MFPELRKRAQKAGQPPGTLIYTGEQQATVPSITVITYNKETFNKAVGTSLEDCLPAKKTTDFTWVNVVGLHDTEMINELAKRYNLHPLSVEDILHVGQRPKVEDFENYIFTTLKMLFKNPKQLTFSVEQLSIAFGKNFVLSFQERETGLFTQILERICSSPGQRLREQGSDYLAYRLMDTVVDQYFVVLDDIGDQIERVEELIITDPTPKNSRMLYRLKRQILILRKAIWPMRKIINHLIQSDDDELISTYTRVYLRDIYDHTAQAIDTLEIFRDMLSNMLDMYLSGLTNKMNEIMKVLTIIATIFIPITFIASFYGMNFQNMPELHWRWGYPITLVLMVLVTVGMIIYFWRRRWIW